MLQVAEIRRSFQATWLIFRGDAGGLQLLDRSIDGFWRSFAVIFLVLPIHAVMEFAAARTDGSSETAGARIVESLPLVLIDWVAFPLILAALARSLNVSGTYVSYVVARNWAALIAVAATAVPMILHGAGWIDGTTTVIVSLGVLALALRLHYLIMRFALGVTPPLAVGLVIADLVVTLTLMRVLS